jgi:hypothetical protein
MVERNGCALLLLSVSGNLGSATLPIGKKGKKHLHLLGAVPHVTDVVAAAPGLAHQPVDYVSVVDARHLASERT